MRWLVDEIVLPDFAPIVDGKIICRCSDINSKTITDVRTYFVVKRGYPTV
jgi:hypothetical protein